MAEELSALTLEETKLFRFCETVVKEGRSSRPFYEVGTALKEIRDHKLYREDYDTFEAYCRERWRFSRIHAHRLIEATAVLQNVLPIGNKLSPGSHESQFRPLISLEPEQQRQVWQLAVESSGNGQPTARDVEEALQRLFDKTWVAPQQELPAEEIEDRALWQRVDEVARKLKARPKVWFAQLVSLEERRLGVQKLETWTSAFEKEFPESTRPEKSAAGALTPAASN